MLFKSLLAIGAVLPSAFAGFMMSSNTGHCEEQSCVVAALAGSTGQTASDFPPNTNVTGDDPTGDCCVLQHNPQFADIIYRERPNLKGNCPANAQKRHILQERALDVMLENIKRSGCSERTLFFARGTFEFGDLGITIGPALAKALGSSWGTVGVNYDSSIAGDYCLGIPGALVALPLLEQLAKTCPQTKIVMGGYSQGAMVVRGALARASDAARKLVKMVVTFGDPFDGAYIKSYKGPILTYCDPADGVCTGHLDISFAHLSYGGDVTPAAKIINAYVPA